jgi:hypothetical protein
MGNLVSGISSVQLRRAFKVKTQIEKLEWKLAKLVGASKRGGSYNGNGVTAPRNMSAEGKARIAAAQKKRWAAWRKSNPA